MRSNFFLFQALTTEETFIEASSDHVKLSPQDIVIEAVTRDMVKALRNEDVYHEIYRQLLSIVIDTEKAVTSRQARRALKRITYDGALLAKHLEFQNQPAESTGASRTNRRSRQPSISPSQSPLWNNILAVLEILQTKKDISRVELLIAPLFHLLKCCVNEEEQVPLEYSKQIILSCLLSCCQKLPAGE